MNDRSRESDHYTRKGKISVVSLTPKFKANERDAAKKVIEQRLFEVFCKYI